MEAPPKIFNLAEIRFLQNNQKSMANWFEKAKVH